ncbi:MAG TPA: patatin-like phospholipase family protein [Longimicrobium sp.]|nr:patatin-like phospholipase family protein [Longimicrobium sp.]
MTQRIALVISGGGSKGAFAVGAVKHLMGTLGMEFDLFAGTSTGALITPLLAAMGRAALPVLEREYTTVRDADIIRPRQPEETALVSSSFATTDPLADRIRGQVTEAVWNALRASPKQVFLTTVNLRTGRLVYFQTGPAAVPSNGDVVRVQDRDTLMRAMLASASIPVLMQPTPIPQGTPAEFVDGGVREYAPIQVAIDAGVTDIVCILLAPAVRGPAEQRLDRLAGVLKRTIDLLSEEVGENDVRTSQLYTQAVRYLAEVRLRLQRDHGLSQQQIDAAFAPPNAVNPFVGKRAVSLRIIRPQRRLAGETLGFDPAAMRANLAYGTECAQQQWPAGVLV